MLLGPAEIRALIPHAGDMCLLSGVSQWDATHIRCTAHSHRDANNPLARNGKVHALCGIEFAAQAMAIHGGLTGKTRKRPRAGLLVSVRDVAARVRNLSDYAEDLQIEAEKLMDAGTSVSYSFSIRAGARELLSGRAMVVLDAEEIKS